MIDCDFEEPITCGYLQWVTNSNRATYVRAKGKSKSRQASSSDGILSSSHG